MATGVTASAHGAAMMALATVTCLAIAPVAGYSAAGAESWETLEQGVSLRLTQILPDQVRGFYQARGFDPTTTNEIARNCVFQTVMRNVSAPAAIHFRLADWRAITPAGEQRLRLESDWHALWEERGAPSHARLAFRWAQFPLEHTYEIGDWNMGMTMYPRPPGGRFDLRFTWTVNAVEHQAVLRGIRCATEEDQ